MTPRNAQRRVGLFLALIGVATLLAIPPSAAGNHTATGNNNDQWESALDVGPLDPFAAAADNTALPEASTQAGEPLTEVGPALCQGGEMGRTVWFLVTGTGVRTTVTTRGSDFDTVLAVYDTDGSGTLGNGPPTDANLIGCDDDGNDFGDGQSELVFSAGDGFGYLIQVGGFHPDMGTPATGNVELELYTPPDNDNQAGAQPVQAGTSSPADNIGATRQSGEPATCGSSDYGKTVWYRWVAPSDGDVVFGASAVLLDTVLGLYPAGSRSRLDCSDDAVGSGTSSRLSRRVRGGASYDIQVGGFGGGQAAEDGDFNFNVEFTARPDWDGDGSTEPADCNDNNPAVEPGVEDVRNGIDDDCDKIIDPDRDGDKSLRAPLGKDCNDNNRRVHPGAREVRGNKTDEDCNKKRAPFRRITADAVIRGLAGSSFKVKRLVVKRVPRRARVTMRCRKPGGGSCGRDGKRAQAARTVRLGGLPATLKAGSVVTVRAVRRGYIGFQERLKIRRFAVPRSTTRCMMPGARKARRKCPGIR